jgi:aldose 1-epimerase
MGGLGDSVTLGAPDALQMTVLAYGATVASLRVPDASGSSDNVVLGVADYTRPHPYFGAVVGRYANRISRGRFSLNGTDYQLTLNNGPNALHGGPEGFSRRIWTLDHRDARRAVLSYHSADGEEGYPGALDVQVTYTVTENAVEIGYRATAVDDDTILNLTNHSYFNLKGEGTVLDHRLRIDADSYTPVDETLIPTGEIASVALTPFDFRPPTTIGTRLHDTHVQLRFGQGYDHNWVLNGGMTKVPRLVAEIEEPTRRRRLSILTTEPGLQFYAGTQLDGAFGYPRYGGLALETQHFPDSPNHLLFPSTVLRGGESYTSTTIWRFETF